MYDTTLYPLNPHELQKKTLTEILLVNRCLILISFILDDGFKFQQVNSIGRVSTSITLFFV